LTKKSSLKKKRLIIHKGGFPGATITPILSLLGGLLRNAARQETGVDGSKVSGSDAGR